MSKICSYDAIEFSNHNEAPIFFIACKRKTDPEKINGGYVNYKTLVYANLEPLIVAKKPLVVMVEIFNKILPLGIPRSL